MNDDKKNSETGLAPRAPDALADDAVTGEVLDGLPPEPLDRRRIVHMQPLQPMTTNELLAAAKDLGVRPLTTRETLEALGMRPATEAETEAFHKQYETRDGVTIDPDDTVQADGETWMTRAAMQRRFQLDDAPLFPNADLERQGTCQWCSAELDSGFPRRCQNCGLVEHDCGRKYERLGNRRLCRHCVVVDLTPIGDGMPDKVMLDEHGELQLVDTKPFANVPSISYDLGELKLEFHKLSLDRRELWDHPWQFVGFRNKE